ncbi:MAG: cation-translocating P-type ATPase [Anaerolineales bacterium]
MQKLRIWLSNPRERRKGMVILSGALILGGLAAGQLFGLQDLRSLLMTLAAVAAGWDIALRAWNGLRTRYISIELLVTIAAGGALLIGEFWEAAAVTFLFILGAYLEARTLSQTRQVLQQLLELAPSTAIVLREGRQVEVLPHEIQQDETVLVKPGAKLPVDGQVIEGRSAIDESAITGEPMPEVKTQGSSVFAGTINQNGLLHVRATGVGADTTLARIIRRVEEAQEEKAPTQRFIERFSRWYTPAIISLSGLVFLLTQDVELSLTLLVIGCPGALVISTPVSVVAGIGRAAKSGILIKGGEYLENAGKISAVALDKTGTLTQGQPRLTDVIVLQRSALRVPTSPATGDSLLIESQTVGAEWTEGQQDLLWLAAIAEAGSEHPLAVPILEAADTLSRDDPLPVADAFEAFTGKGVRARYQDSEILVGSQVFMEEMEVLLDGDVRERLARLKEDGKTAVVVARDGFTLGILGISDPIRSAAYQVIERLRKTGIERIAMLTGDDPVTANAIAREAGIEEVYAGLLPEEKLNVIRKLQNQGHVVAMTGDGINDAPALAAADIGIAMGAAGTDIAIETADIALMADDLNKIPQAVHISKATLKNIRQNVAIALATVSALLIGVLLGEVHMAGGMLVHEASVLVVILNGMRLLRA